MSAKMKKRLLNKNPLKRQQPERLHLLLKGQHKSKAKVSLSLESFNLVRLAALNLKPRVLQPENPNQSLNLL
jgi:hypothetical protein